MGLFVGPVLKMWLVNTIKSLLFSNKKTTQKWGKAQFSSGFDVIGVTGFEPVSGITKAPFLLSFSFAVGPFVGPRFIAAR